LRRSLWIDSLLLTALAWAMPAAGQPRLEGLRTEVLDRHAGRGLVVAQRPLPPDVSPGALRQQLFEQAEDGKLVLIAEEVAFAAYAPDGAILFVSGDTLFELDGRQRRPIARPVLPDFAVDPLGQRIAVVRPDAEPETWIELIDRDGGHLAVLSEAEGVNALPCFSPDGASVYFLSGRTGVASWFGVHEDGGRLGQLTNRGLRPGPDVLGRSFVPPPVSRESLRFRSAAIVEYDAGDLTWRVDLESGNGEPIEEVRR
jgi:TolB protein